METKPTPEEPESVYDDTGHQPDETGAPIHIDVDPVIPTGICRYC